jgi:NAD(P)H-nitrite reductase
MGNLVRETHEAHGVKFHLGRTPAAIHDRYVQLDDGTKLDCDLVLLESASPKHTLAEQAASRLTTVCW